MEPIEVTVEILKLKKLFMKRTTDVDELKWFSLPVDLVIHPDFHYVDPFEFKAFIYIVGIAAKFKTSVIRIDVAYIAYTLRLEVGQVNSMLKKLEGKQTAIRENGYEPPAEPEAAEKQPAANARPRGGRSVATTEEDSREDYKRKEKKEEASFENTEQNESTDDDLLAAVDLFVKDSGSNPILKAALPFISFPVIKTLVQKYRRPWLDDSIAQAVTTEIGKTKHKELARIKDLDGSLLRWFKLEKKPQFRDPGKNAGGFFDHIDPEKQKFGPVAV